MPSWSRNSLYITEPESSLLSSQQATLLPILNQTRQILSLPHTSQLLILVFRLLSDFPTRVLHSYHSTMTFLVPSSDRFSFTFSLVLFHLLFSLVPPSVWSRSTSVWPPHCCTLLHSGCETMVHVPGYRR